MKLKSTKKKNIWENPLIRFLYMPIQLEYPYLKFLGPQHFKFGIFLDPAIFA
jgi:hypothetical protein